MSTLIRVSRPEMNLTASGKAVYVTLMNEFSRNPSGFFTAAGGIFRHDSRQINVCDRSSKRKRMFPDSMGGILKVSTEAELLSLITRLTQSPIFFTVDVERSSKAACSNVRYITRGQLAVTVNTKHPYILQLLQTQLAQGMEALKEGKHFAVEFDFNPVIISWMQTLFQNRDNEDPLGCDCNNHYTCENGKVTVTSYSEFEDCYACQYPTVLAWIVCLPCCLLTCPCYRVHRALTVVDVGGVVNGVIAMYWSPVAQLRNMEDTIACVLELFNHDQAVEATAADLPPSYDVVVRAPPPPNGPPTYSQTAGHYSPQVYNQSTVQDQQPHQQQMPYHQPAGNPPSNVV